MDGSYVLNYASRPPRIATGPVDSHGDDDPSLVTVRILSSAQVVRRCDKTNPMNSTVVHCLSSKNQQAKAKSAETFGLVPADVTMYDWYQGGTKKSTE